MSAVPATAIVRERENLEGNPSARGCGSQPFGRHQIGGGYCRFSLLAGRAPAKACCATKTSVTNLKRTARIARGSAGLACVGRPGAAPAAALLADQIHGGTCAGRGCPRSAARFVKAATGLASFSAGACCTSQATRCTDRVETLAVIATRIAERTARDAVEHTSAGGTGAASKTGWACGICANTGVGPCVAASTV